MTITDRDVADHHAAGALADELPYWGWLPDERTCLTRRGELVTIARLSPTVVDGHTPAQLDAVLQRWQRMLSGVDARTRLYFYLLRRPATFPDADTGLSAVADLGQRKRRAFLGARIQQIDTFVAWQRASPGRPWERPSIASCQARRDRGRSPSTTAPSFSRAPLKTGPIAAACSSTSFGRGNLSKTRLLNRLTGGYETNA